MSALVDYLSRLTFDGSAVSFVVQLRNACCASLSAHNIPLRSDEIFICADIDAASLFACATRARSVLVPSELSRFYALPCSLAVILALDEGLARVHWVAHQSFLDRPSLAALAADVAVFFLCGYSVHASQPSLAYMDYASWEACNFASQRSSQAREFWPRYLAGCMFPSLSSTSRRISSNVDNSPLRRCCSALDLFVDFALFWALYTQLEDFIICLPHDLRDVSGLLPTTLGPLTHLVPVRFRADVRADGDFDAKSFKRLAKASSLEALSRCTLSHFQIAELLGLASAGSLCSTLFDWQCHDEQEWFPVLPLCFGSKVVASCSLRTGRWGFAVQDCDTAPTNLLQLVRCFQQFLSSGHGTDRPELLDEQCTWCMTEEPNQTKFRFADWNEPVASRFARTAVSHPETPALEYQGQGLSYAALLAATVSFAGCLLSNLQRSNTVTRQPRVLVCVHRSFGLVVSLLSCLYASMVYVPLDPSTPEARCKKIISDAAPDLFICDPDLREKLVPVLASNILSPPSNTALLGCHPLSSVPSQIPYCLLNMNRSYASFPQHTCSPSSLHNIIYTSGSTGMPKGVAVAECGMLNLISDWQSRTAIGLGDVMLGQYSIAFDPHSSHFFGTLSIGATLLLAQDGAGRDGALMAQLLDKCTIASCTPTGWNVVIASGWTGNSQLLALSGGEPLHIGVAQRLLPLVKQLSNCWGPTETTVQSAVQRRVDGLSVNIGSPLLNQRVFVIGKTGGCCPFLTPGELVIAGSGVSLGYLNMPLATAERFIPERRLGILSADYDALRIPTHLALHVCGGGCTFFSRDSGWWDLQYLLHCSGRLDAMVKVRGYRVDLGDVESALSHVLESLGSGRAARCAVVPASAETTVALVAWVEGTVDDLDAFRRAIFERLELLLPSYMLPSRLSIVDRLPVNASGKIDRTALGMLHAPVVEHGLADAVEAALCSLHTQQASPHTRSISSAENLFLLGLDSFVAMRIAARVLHSYDVALSVADVLNHSSVAELWNLIRTRQAEQVVPLMSLSSQSPLAPSSIVVGVAVVDVPGHVNPLLPVMRQISLQVPVVWFTSEAMRSRVESSGAVVIPVPVRPLPLPSVQKEWSATRYLGWILDNAAAMLPFYLQAFRREAVSTVVYDRELVGARLAAEVLGIRCVLSCSTFPVNQHFSHLNLNEVVGPEAVALQELLTSLTRRYSLQDRSVRHLWEAEESCSLVFMPRLFHPLGNSFGDNFHFVGSVVTPSGFDLQQTRSKLALVSLGTLFFDWPEFFQECAFAFSELAGWQAIFAVGSELIKSKLHSIPENVRVEASVPQLEVLAKACLFITHGGMNSVQEAVAFLVPMIVIPRSVDQFAVAKRVEELGLGIWLRESAQPSRTALLAAVRHISAHRRHYVDNLTKLANLSRVGGGCMEAARLILNPSSQFNLPDWPCVRSRSQDCEAPSSFPLSSIQRSLWLHHHLLPLPDRAALNVQGECLVGDCSGALETGFSEVAALSLLRKLFEGLLYRYDIFRTSFSSAGTPDPMATVHALPVASDMISSVSVVSSEVDVVRAALAPFEVVDWPLLRLMLVRRVSETCEAAYCWTVAIVAHHLVLDGDSFLLLAQEISELFRLNHMTGRLDGSSPSQLKASQYSEFVEWESLLVQSGWHRASLEFWCSQLQDAPRRLSLRLPGSGCDLDHQGDLEHHFELAPDVVSSLRSRANTWRVTLFAMAFISFMCCVRDVTGEDDFVVGVPWANRERHPLASIIGPVVTTLPFRCVVPKHIFLEDGVFIMAVRKQVLSGFKHAHVSTDDIIRELQIPRSGTHTPLFQTLFVFHRAAAAPGLLINSAHRGGDFAVSDVAVPVRHDLTVRLTDALPGLPIGGSLQCRQQLVTARRARVAIRTLLASYSSLAQCSWFSASDPEQTAILHEPNQTLFSFDHHRSSIWALFTEVAQSRPQVVALKQDHRCLSYIDLRCRALRLAKPLTNVKERCAPLQRQLVVVISLEKSFSLLAAYLAVLSVGGCYVPIDASLPAGRCEDIVIDCKPSYGMFSESVWPKFKATCNYPYVVLALDDSHVVESASCSPSAFHTVTPVIAAGAVHSVIYTSGTTGKPKGVVIPCSAATNLLRNMSLDFRFELGVSVSLCHSGIGFDMSNWEIYPALITGGMVLLAHDGTTVDGVLMGKLLSTCSCAFLTPTAWKLVLASGWPGNSSLQAMSAGEALHQDVADGLLPLVAGLLNLWGPTETFVGSATSWCSRYVPINIGKPLLNQTLYILDGMMRPCYSDCPGEVFIGGAGVSFGYLNQRSLTACKFPSNPFPKPSETLCTGERSRMFRSGDICHWGSQLNIFLHGRSDTQVKIRGFRVELAEVESALCDPGTGVGVRQAVVLANRGPDKSVEALYAFVVLRDANCRASSEQCVSSTTVQFLRRRLSSRLPSYMVPADVFVIDTIPLTPNGKLNLRQLESIIALSPQRNLECDGVVYSEMQRSIWAVLDSAFGWRGRELSSSDPSASLIGLDSLRAMAVVAKLAEFGVKLPVSEVLSCDSVSALFSKVETGLRSDSAVPQLPPWPSVGGSTTAIGRVPLSATQRSLWLHHHLLEPSERAALNSGPGLVKIEHASVLFSHLHSTDTTAEVRLLVHLRYAISLLLQENELLRSRFPMLNEEVEPYAIILPLTHGAERYAERYPSGAWYDEVSLNTLARIEIIDGYDSSEVSTDAEPLSFTDGPLIKISWVRSCDIEKNFTCNWSHVSVVVHHVLTDGDSNRLLIQELGKAFQRSTTMSSDFYNLWPEPRSPLAKPQFRQYVDWEKSLYESGWYARSLRFWLSELRGAPVRMSLSVPGASPKSMLRGGAQQFLFSVEEVQKLSSVATALGVTRFMLFLAALLLALRKFTSDDDLVLGIPWANREMPETRELIGPLVNTLPFRWTFVQELPNTDFIKTLRAKVLMAFTHTHASTDAIVKDLKLSRSRDHSPLFQVIFTTQAPVAAGSVASADPWQDLPVRATPVRHDLVLLLSDLQSTGKAMEGHMLFRTGVLSHVRAQLLSDGYMSALRRLLSLPEVYQNYYALLMEPNQSQQLFQSWNQSLWWSFEQQAAMSSQSAVAVEDQVERLSYRTLYKRSLHASVAITRAICPAYTQRQFRVLVSMEKSVPLIIALLAVCRLHMAYVPVDASLPEERCRSIFLDSQPDFGLFSQHAWRKFQSFFSSPRLLLPLPVTCAEPPRFLRRMQHCCLDSHNVHSIIFTSGSTGRPKAVIVSSCAAINILQDLANRICHQNAYPRCLAHSSIGFDVSTWELFSSLFVGGSVVLVPDGSTRDGSLMASLLYSCNVAFMTPSAWKLVLASEWSGSRDLVALSGGEPLPLPLASALLPKVEVLWNIWGPTETFICSAATRDAAAVPIGIGIPLANQTIYIVDRCGSPVAPFTPGELLVGGVGVGYGYLMQSSSDFQEDSYLANANIGGHLPHRRKMLYRTRDVGYWNAESNIVLHGRLGGQIKLRGYRVEVQEIEQLLLAPELALRSATVVPVRANDGTVIRLDAFVQPFKRKIAALEVKAEIVRLRTFLQKKLPSYMIPSCIVFIDMLPLTPNGKLDTNALRSLVQTSSVGQPWSQPHSVPLSELETSVLHIVSEVLGTRAVRYRESLVSLGLDSLYAMRIATWLSKHLGMKLSVGEVLESETCEELCDRLDSRSRGCLPAIPEHAPYKPLRYSFVEHLVLAGRVCSVVRWPTACLGATHCVFIHGAADVGLSFQGVVDWLPSTFAVAAPSQEADHYARSLLELDSFFSTLPSTSLPVLYGHSLGAVVATMYAGLRPDRVSLLVNAEGFIPREPVAGSAVTLSRLLDSVSESPEVRFSSFSSLARTIHLRQPLISPAYCEFLARCWGTRTVEDDVVLTAFQRHHVLPYLEEYQACITRIRCQHLLLVGSHSTYYAGDFIASIFPAVESAQIPGCSHSIHSEAPEQVACLLTARVLRKRKNNRIRSHSGINP